MYKGNAVARLAKGSLTAIGEKVTLAIVVELESIDLDGQGSKSRAAMC